MVFIQPLNVWITAPNDRRRKKLIGTKSAILPSVIPLLFLIPPQGQKPLPQCPPHYCQLPIKVAFTLKNVFLGNFPHITPLHLSYILNDLLFKDGRRTWFVKCEMLVHLIFPFFKPFLWPFPCWLAIVTKGDYVKLGGAVWRNIWRIFF